jgi:hypothetical protein
MRRGLFTVLHIFSVVGLTTASGMAGRHQAAQQSLITSLQQRR